MHKYLQSVSLEAISTVEEYLDMLSLSRLKPTLEKHGITQVADLLQLTPSSMEAMGIPYGPRQRLLRAGEMRRKEMMRPTQPSASDAATQGVQHEMLPSLSTQSSGSSVPSQQMPPPPPPNSQNSREAQPPSAREMADAGENAVAMLCNSTSSLYIDSTISKPDFAQARRATRPALPLSDAPAQPDHCARAPRA
jgi:hypothetical protein